MSTEAVNALYARAGDDGITFSRVDNGDVVDTVGFALYELHELAARDIEACFSGCWRLIDSCHTEARATR